MYEVVTGKVLWEERRKIEMNAPENGRTTSTFGWRKLCRKRRRRRRRRERDQQE